MCSFLIGAEEIVTEITIIAKKGITIFLYVRDWTESVNIPLYKKRANTECANYQTTLHPAGDIA